MKTAIVTDGTIFTSRKDIREFLQAIADSGIKINPSKAGKKLKMTAGSVTDAWKKLEEDNQITATIFIKEKAWGEKIWKKKTKN